MARANFAIICDTSCDISYEWLINHEVEVVTQHVRYNNKDMRDGRDIDYAAFLEQLAKSNAHPTKSANWSVSRPSADEYRQAIQNCINKGLQDIIIVAPSQKAAATCASAEAAWRRMQYDANIHLVDSRRISLGFGFLVSALVRLRGAGLSCEDALQELKQMREKIQFFVIPMPTTPILRHVSCQSMREKLSFGVQKFLAQRPLLQMTDDGAFRVISSSSDYTDDTGILARYISKYAFEHGSVLLMKLSTGDERALKLLDRPLNTNEFSSTHYDTRIASPSTVCRIGRGGVGVAFIAERDIPAHMRVQAGEEDL